MSYKLEQELHKRSDGSFYSRIQVLLDNVVQGIELTERATHFDTGSKLSTAEIRLIIKGNNSTLDTNVNKEGNYLIVKAYLTDNSGVILDKVTSNSVDAIID